MDKQNDIKSLLTHLVSNLDNITNWYPLILGFDKSVVESTIARQQIPQIVHHASLAIGRFKHEEAANYIALGLYLYPSRMIDEVHRTGLFRSSKYQFRATCLRRVLTIVLTERKPLELSQEFIDYSSSILNLTEVSPYIHGLNETIRQFIKKRQSVFLKTVVALVDTLFMVEHYADISLSTEKWEHYPNEALAESASYLIHCFDTVIGIKSQHFNFIDEENLISGFYHSMLVKGCKIRAYLEAEILIDAFDYQCHRDKHSFTIDPPNAQIEMSIRLGFAQHEQSSIRDSVARKEALLDGGRSILELTDYFYEHFHQSVVKTLEWPFKRYVFALPDTPEFAELFSYNGLFVEEKLFLENIMESELSTWEELNNFEISDGITVLDFVKVNRLFTFLRLITRKHLEPLLEDEPRLVYRSLVPVFDEHKFATLIGWCLPPEKIGEITRLMAWASGKSGLIDMQYKPIIRSSDYLLSPLNLLGTTHWYRNLAYTEKRRIIQSTEEDAASRALAEVMGRVCQFSQKTFKTKIDGEEFEIDVIVRFGDMLFVFECKHALLPCNTHELRTSYDHMKKGAVTLTRIVQMLKSKGGEKKLYRRLGWNVQPAEKIVTCIVSCNGMFPGLSIDGHPIRRWGELRNMIESGVVKTGMVNFGTDELSDKNRNLLELNLWDGPELTPKFLWRYISQNLLHDPIFRSMLSWEYSYRVGKMKLKFSSFLLDPAIFHENLKELAN